MKTYDLTISSLCDWEFRNVHAEHFEMGIVPEWDGTEEHTSCSGHSCTVRAAFAELHNVLVDCRPPPFTKDCIVQLTTRKVSLIHYSMALHKDALS